MDKRIEIPVMHCFDNNYVIPGAVSFYSMLKYASKEYSYKLFVLHSNITNQNQQLLTSVVSRFPNASLEFINMENRFDDIWVNLRYSGHFTKEVLYKLLVASIFPQYEKLIITDVDVLFQRDISPSYFAFDPEEPVCFAGVHQISPRGSFLEKYYEGYKEDFGEDVLQQLKICGGYLVANLKYIRENRKEDQFIAYLTENAYRLRQSEQDVMNFCCKESEIRYLPLNNIVCTYMYGIFRDSRLLHTDPFYTDEELLEAMAHPIQIHYATATKPWKGSLSTKADLWMEILRESGAYDEYLKKTVSISQGSPEQVDLSLLGSGWKPNDSVVIVSVLCCTYNHEAFIRKALEGIANQKVSFPYEVIVADDASTDNTRQIIEEFAEKYPGRFHCILREKNVGIGKNYYDALCHVSGKYLAICDGDDCWVDNEKLQRQVDYMEAHPDCTVCCASFLQHIHSEEGIKEEPFHVEKYIESIIPVKEMYSFNDLLYCRFIASCTTMLRWQYLGRVPGFLQFYPIIDFPLTLLHAAGGKIGVMHNYYPSIYNVHKNNLTNSKASDKLLSLSNCILQEVDQYLDYHFTTVISEYITLQTTAVNNKGRLSRAIKAKYYLLLHIMAEAYMHFVPDFIKDIYRKIKRRVKRTIGR